MEGSTETHPCERVFGSCVGGESCPFKDAPKSACVAFLKGRCRFGLRCKEPHLLLIQGKYVSAVHPCVRIYGSCRYGDQCEYASLSSDTCIKFLKGRCTFGDRCKEQHPGATPGWAAPAGMNSNYVGGMGFDLGLAPLPMPFGVPFSPFGFVPNFGVPTDDGGGRDKRINDSSGSWKKSVNYFQATGGGRLHPCVRIYGSCKHGVTCKYAMVPIGACLQHIKGCCKFGDKCREQHITVSQRDKAKHPCERIYGFCQDGDSCRYAKYSANTCLMFLKGRCRFGDKCREVHSRDEAESGTSSANANVE